MIERARTRRVADDRRDRRRVYFTPETVTKLRPERKQYLAWDAWDPDRTRGPLPARGLAILVSPLGTKSWRCLFYFRGSSKPNYKYLGRVHEIPLSDGNGVERKFDSETERLAAEIEEMRRLTRDARRLANDGKDPRDPTRSDSFEAAFAAFIETEQIGRRKNKSARETEKFVLANFPSWKPRAVAAITFREIDAALAKIRDGDPNTGARPRASASIRLFSHLRDFFGWCALGDRYIKASPMAGMRPPATAAGRDRHYSDDEIRAIWEAADAVGEPVGSYVKLVMLTALRRNELALARWDEFEFDGARPTLLTVPTERVKLKAATKAAKRPVYVVPISPLAQRILKGLPKGSDRVFPGLNPDRVAEKMVAAGAPKDFGLHLARHTVATWLENRGRSEWERGLVLNHAGKNQVTAGYSHGHAVDLKRQMLDEWSDHVEGLVGGENVAVLR